MNVDEQAMHPDHSPVSKSRTGIKRVNNVPLFIGIGVALLFTGIIIMVAVKRMPEETAFTEDKTMTPIRRDNQKMVDDIVGKYKKSGIVSAEDAMQHAGGITTRTDAAANMPLIGQLETLSPPVMDSQDLILENPVDSEMENIKRAKIQAFAEAVKAPMHINLPDNPVAATEVNADIASQQQMIQQELAQLKSTDLNAGYQARLQQMQSMMQANANPEKSTGKSDPFMLLEDKKNRFELESFMEAPKTPFTLRAGSIIPGVMISAVNPKFPGQIMGQVASSVYDTATGKYNLIPQGTRLIGTYASDIGYAQEAVLIVWQRLIFPDGKAFDLGAMPGADSSGVAGFKDEVNNHYIKTFGSALLMTGIVGGIAYSQQVNNSPFNTQPTAGSVLSEALGQQLGQVSAQMIMKNLNIAPDLHIRTGYQFNVMVTKDMNFAKPWQAFDYRRHA